MADVRDVLSPYHYVPATSWGYSGPPASAPAPPPPPPVAKKRPRSVAKNNMDPDEYGNYSADDSEDEFKPSDNDSEDESRPAKHKASFKPRPAPPKTAYQRAKVRMEEKRALDVLLSVAASIETGKVGESSSSNKRSVKRVKLSSSAVAIVSYPIVTYPIGHEIFEQFNNWNLTDIPGSTNPARRVRRLLVKKLFGRDTDEAVKEANRINKAIVSWQQNQDKKNAVHAAEVVGVELSTVITAKDNEITTLKDENSTLKALLTRNGILY